MAEWIVKLIPFGNPESKLFVLKTEGGFGIEDFAGWHLERFTFTTDGSGEAVLTLAHTPTALDWVACLLCGEDQRVIAATAFTGTSLTVKKRRLRYDKTVTPTGLVTDAPGGVSVASTAGTLTEMETATATAVATPSTTGADDGSGGATDNAISDVSVDVDVTIDPHQHEVNFLYDHKHTLTYAATSLEVAASEATALIVLYR